MTPEHIPFFQNWPWLLLFIYSVTVPLKQSHKEAVCAGLCHAGTKALSERLLTTFRPLRKQRHQPGGRHANAFSKNFGINQRGGCKGPLILLLHHNVKPPKAGVLLQTCCDDLLVLLAVDGAGGVDQALQPGEPEAVVQTLQLEGGQGCQTRFDFFLVCRRSVVSDAHHT